MSKNGYVHGYSDREASRLFDQANSLTELLHHDTHYPPGSQVLEAGCGVGAQTITLAQNSPQAHLTSLDISLPSVNAARALIDRENITNVTFHVADLFNLPFEPESFDHIFVCFVLEHLPQPLAALQTLKLFLKSSGTITVIEGDHGSTYFYPDSQAARQTIQCLIDIQAKLGGNALIGRELFPLLKKAGFRQISVSPRMVYVDAGKPELVEGFTKNTFTAMVEAVKAQALELQLIDAATWDMGIRDLYRTTQTDGTFCYTFFKGIAVK